MVKSQIDQLQKDFLGKSNKITLVSEFRNLPQKILKIAARKELDWWVFAIHCCWVEVKISKSILPGILGQLARRGSVAVAVGVSEMWQVTHNTWHLTPDTWHVTHDARHLIKKLEIKENGIGATNAKKMRHVSWVMSHLSWFHVWPFTCHLSPVTWPLFYAASAAMKVPGGLVMQLREV